MARVTGVGGVFLRSADPKALGAWYAKHLGFEVGEYGATFSWKDDVPKGTGMTAWNPFPMAAPLRGARDAADRRRRRHRLSHLRAAARALDGAPPITSAGGLDMFIAKIPP